MRQWKQWPTDIELSTPVGTVFLTITERHHIVVDAQSRRNYLTVRGKPYAVFFHLFDYGDGFEPSPDNRMCIKRTDKALAASRQEQILQAVVPRVNQWARQNSQILSEAQACHLNNEILSLENQLADWLVQVRQTRKKIKELQASLKAEGRLSSAEGPPQINPVTRGEISPVPGKTCLYCGIPLEIHPEEQNSERPPGCVRCAAPGNFLQSGDNGIGDSIKPKVLIEVSDGVATCQTLGDVEVCVVDYDVLEMGGDCDIPEAFYESFAGLREAVATFKHQE